MRNADVNLLVNRPENCDSLDSNGIAANDLFYSNFHESYLMKKKKIILGTGKHDTIGPWISMVNHGLH